MKVLIDNIKSIKANDYMHVALPTLEGLVFVSTNNIIYCNSEGNYTRFHFKDETHFLVSRPLHEYDEILPKELFYRLYNEYIVNLNLGNDYPDGPMSSFGKNNNLQSLFLRDIFE